MILTSILATLALGGFQAKPLTCPIMGGSIDKGSPSSEYNGVRVAYCCGDCKGQFEHAPAKALQAAAKKGNVVGQFMFDAVSGNHIDPAKAKGGSSDFGGVRFYFENAEDKAAFDKEPKKYGVLPAKEALVCPVSKEAIAGYDKANSFADYKGVRYYICCADCPASFTKDPAKYAAQVSAKVQTPGVYGAAPAKSDDKPPFQAMSYSCKHCGMQIKVNAAGDMDKTCTVCGCGKSNAACKPGK